ncbi:MAG: Na(+)-translocating NADH-quinone reductase subunit A [Bacteroides sp.]|nr:Na(+)-translocating NADH-quinone reductase subunit A [Bacteroides sp.]MCM1412872.1 Na(+)-translocating NADH-quinone reductase subunit A [Bacteroides sp.]MCM1471541.1 Na(+)-translocating NADH-quinone reductase subunit A [Bacteroides sp.]
MFDEISIRRGLDLRLKGSVDGSAPVSRIEVGRVALTPDDFPGFTPRVLVKPGQTVAAGQPLMSDKLHPEIVLVSPTGGTVDDVVRGERRKVLRVVVTCDGTEPVAAAERPDKSAESIRRAMLSSGIWPLMRQLPYDIVPDPTVAPRDIFITAFDSAPLATSLLARTADKTDCVAAGVEALASLTEGKVYIGINPEEADNEVWQKIAATGNGKVKITVFKGPHPVGLPSIQAANIAPVNKGETIWLLDITVAVRLGDVVLNGRADWSTTVAITGSEVTEPAEVVTVVGAEIAPLTAGRIADNDCHKRIIAGNVLTGINVGPDGFLRFPYRQITVIPEGDDVNEFMGWASLSPNKMSENRSFLSKLLGGKKFAPDARLNGGRRAMIMSGQYEKVFPMSVMPEYLVKAILARDIDKMEALGIYEVTPADFALCEYVDPSKLELQKIVREGLDYLRKELN